MYGFESFPPGEGIESDVVIAPVKNLSVGSTGLSSISNSNVYSLSL